MGGKLISLEVTVFNILDNFALNFSASLDASFYSRSRDGKAGNTR